MRNIFLTVVIFFLIGSISHATTPKIIVKSAAINTDTVEITLELQLQMFCESDLESENLSDLFDFRNVGENNFAVSFTRSYLFSEGYLDENGMKRSCVPKNNIFKTVSYDLFQLKYNYVAFGKLLPKYNIGILDKLDNNYRFQKQISLNLPTQLLRQLKSYSNGYHSMLIIGKSPEHNIEYDNLEISASVFFDRAGQPHKVLFQTHPKACERDEYGFVSGACAVRGGMFVISQLIKVYESHEPGEDPLKVYTLKDQHVLKNRFRGAVDLSLIFRKGNLIRVRIVNFEVEYSDSVEDSDTLEVMEPSVKTTIISDMFPI